MDVADYKNKVSLHLFFNKITETCPNIQTTNKYGSKLNITLNDLKDFKLFEDIFPINVARNIARKAVKTDLFISGDIEQIFVKNFEPRVYKLAEEILIK